MDPFKRTYIRKHGFGVYALFTLNSQSCTKVLYITPYIEDFRSKVPCTLQKSVARVNA